MSSRRLEDCVPELQTKVPLIIQEYQTWYPDRELRIICSLRTTAEQQQLYAKGRTIPPYGASHYITQIDGVVKYSKHNPDPKEPKSKAVDFGVFVNKKYLTQDEYYYPLLELARKNGLVSGLDFARSGKPLQELLDMHIWRDPPHVEVTGSLFMPQQPNGQTT
jgi:hypothetical protein